MTYNKKTGEPLGSIAFETINPEMAAAVRDELRKRNMSENNYAAVLQVAREFSGWRPAE